MLTADADPTKGQTMSEQDLNTDIDDTEGHGYKRDNEDDTEGHGYKREEVDDEDDTEGHGYKH
jgi:hypothetical protein